MIAVFYIGQPRYQEETRENHQRVIARLQQIAPVRVYDCQQPGFDSRSDVPCQGDVGKAGGLQVWDFIKAAQQLTEPVIIKFRSDLWFCESSVEILAAEVQAVINGEYDVCYLGANLKFDFDKERSKYHATAHKKIPDFVVVARRECLRDIEQVRTILADNADNVANGNKVFKIITQDLARSYAVNCYIFLMRVPLTQPTDYAVGRAFIDSYPESGTAHQYWKKFRPNPDAECNHQISIIYTGLPRFPGETKNNHAQMIDRIRRRAPTEVQMYTSNLVSQTNNLWAEVSGGTQVWQFMNAVDQAPGTIIIKFRTDLWFTPAAMDAVMIELDEILEGKQDAAFMGSNWADYLGHDHTRLNSDDCATVQDFVVMARRSSLRSSSDVYTDLARVGMSKLQCGTKVFKSILQPGSDATNAQCQIWLCRKPYVHEPSHYQVGLDYILSYPKQWKMPNAIPWLNSQRHRYE